MATPVIPVVERFWPKVDRSGGLDACWTWLAGTKDGYGWFAMPDGPDRAHRVSWMLEKGPIPDGLFVLHHCDVRPCVNTRHLYLGRNAENAHDREERGGGHDRCGERNGRSKLTLESAEEIRRIHRDEGVGAHRLARQFGLAKSTVNSVLWGHTWRAA